MQSQRLLLCATDAGGISVLLPVAEVLRKTEQISFLFATEQRYAERVRSVVGKNMVVVNSIPSLQQASALLDSFVPSAVICGTTRYESIDRVLTVEARKRGVWSVGVLDEWSNYRRRFENERGELIYLPDKLAIMDDLARQEALAEGLPESLLAITGHPALTRMAGDISRSGIEYAVPSCIARYPGHIVITFLSEELWANFTGAGSMGEPLGFDERVVLRDIIDEAGRLDQPVLIVNKLHPSSDREETVEQFGAVVVATVKTASLHLLLRHSAMAIGMISVALIEAAMIGTPIASYQPNARVQGLSTAVRLGLATLLHDRKALGTWMQAPLPPPRIFPRFVREESVQSIIQLAIDTSA